MAPDWIKIRTEYISTSISLRKIAEKYGIPFQTVRDRAAREHWTELRKKQQHKIGTKTAQKTADRIADGTADRVARLLGATDRLLERAEQALDELDRTAVKHKSVERIVTKQISPETGEPVEITQTDEDVQIETVAAPVDAKALQQIAASLKVIKDIYTSPDTDNDSGVLDDLITALRAAVTDGGGDDD